jgi:hypothetical protein
MKLNRRAFLALPFVAPFAAVAAKAALPTLPKLLTVTEWANKLLAQADLIDRQHAVIAAAQRAYPLHYVRVDEVISYPGHGGGAGDPIDLMMKRNFNYRRDSFCSSSS